MADISKEIKAFQDAVYGEEVRESMISLAEKMNDSSEYAEKQVTTIKDDLVNGNNPVKYSMGVAQWILSPLLVKTLVAKSPEKGAYEKALECFIAGHKYLFVTTNKDDAITQGGLLSNNRWEYITNFNQAKESNARFGILIPTEATTALCILYNGLAAGTTTTGVRIYDVTDVAEVIDNKYVNLLLSPNNIGYSELREIADTYNTYLKGVNICGYINRESYVATGAGWFVDSGVKHIEANHEYLIIIEGDKGANYVGTINRTSSTWEKRIACNIITDALRYGIVTATDNTKSLNISGTNAGTYSFIASTFDVTGMNITPALVETILNTQNQKLTFYDVMQKISNGSWYNKNALVIGDSITAAKKWQLELTNVLGMNVTTHAKGGIGTVAMVDGDKGLGGDYDNETSASGELKPLSVDDVKDKALIIVLPAYNDRGKEDGKVGDCYKTDGSGQSTIAGIVQYTINRIYDTLTKANNLTCNVLYATPHCAGRYPYIDANGYEDFPAGSGRTMETLANTIVSVANHNNIPVCDLWHNSGINKFTWSLFGSQSNAVNTMYSPYELDSSGNPVNDTRIRYVNGESYYQKRDGQVVLEKYTGSAPYPYNGDQLHCSDKGYKRIGECICGTIISKFGN